jgi:hypothetical protein
MNLTYRPHIHVGLGSAPHALTPLEAHGYTLNTPIFVVPNMLLL